MKSDQCWFRHTWTQVSQAAPVYALSKALEKMQHRVSTIPVDKITGLAFILQSESILAYYESGAPLREA